VLAYFTKGLAAFLGPLIVLFYCIFSGNSRLLVKREFIRGLILAILTIVAWHFLQYLLTGPQALGGLRFHFTRAIKMLDGHTGGPNFYQKVIFNKNKPWAVLIYASIPYLLWMAVKRRDKRAVLIFSWVVTTYAVYAFMKTKLNWYIMPAYPALAISSALFLEKFLKKRAYYLSLAVILLGMLIQMPFSWAFKLDDTPDIKVVAAYAKELQRAGNSVYMIGGNDSELFYYDFAMQFDRDSYRSLIRQGKKSIYCIIVPDMLKEKMKEYNFDYQPVYETKRTSLYKLIFKDIR
jgi:4-amino-4-deoxy-L-arabinose transferase-like glycosyltransferase